MPIHHPNYKEGVIGSGQLVWQDIEGKPTIEIQKRAYASIQGLLGSADEPESRPLAAIGWKIDLTKTDGTAWTNDQGQPGWSIHAKHPDAKSVFTGREYPLLLPKVAATLKNINKRTQNTLNQTPEDFLKGLQSDPEKYGTYLLTNIVHHLEKWLKKGPGFGQYNSASDISLGVYDRIGGASQPGIQIKQGSKTYKIVPSHAYTRNKGRHAWSIYIDTTTDSILEDISRAKNFKLLPVGDTYFEAKICLDTDNYTPLSEENRALLESILTLLKSLV